MSLKIRAKTFMKSASYSSGIHDINELNHGLNHFSEKSIDWRVWTAIPVVVLFATLVYPPAFANDKTQNIVKDATVDFTQMMSNPNTRIPPGELRQSQAIAIIPNVIQGGFFFGGRRGTGVMMKHNTDGTWSNPIFVNVTGGSFGLQAGGKSSDVILVFPSATSYEKVMNDEFLKLGSNVTGTAGQSEGHVTRTLDDNTGRDRIYAYTRSEGLFGSTSFEGAKLSLNSSRNEQFYGYKLSPSQIFAIPESKTPETVTALKQALVHAESSN